MKGILKFLLLATVEIIAGMVIALVLSLVSFLLSKVAIGQLLLSIINDGHVSEVVTMISNAAAYLICAMIANKLNAYLPYRVLCIFGVLGAGYGIISGILYGDNIITYIIRLVISLAFFFNASRFIDK